MSASRPSFHLYFFIAGPLETYFQRLDYKELKISYDRHAATQRFFPSSVDVDEACDESPKAKGTWTWPESFLA